MIAATWLGCSHLPPFHKVQMRMMPLDMKNCGFYLVYSSKVSRFFWDRLFLQRASELLSGLLKFITFLLLKALRLVPAVSVKFYIRVAKIRNTYQNMWLSSS